MRLRPESFLFTVYLGALGGLTSFSVDMSLPALVSIGQALHVSAAEAGLTLSFFLGGFALGPVVLGPLSDRFGRRPVLLGGCLCFTLGGLGCVVTPSLPALLFWRLIAGLGAGACATIPMAVVRDFFDGATARTKLSYLATVGTLAPMIAPSLGALVLRFADWRFIYGFLTCAGAALLLATALCFSESIAEKNPGALVPRRLLTNYGRFLGSPICLGYTLVAALNFGAMFSYIASSPLVMIGVLGVSPTVYGWTFAATALGVMAGSFLNGQLSARKVPAPRLFAIGFCLSIGATLTLVAVTLLHIEHVYTLLPLLVLNMCASGMIQPNSIQGALHPMPDIAGIAAALIGSTRMLTGSLAGALVTLTFDGRSAHAMAFSMSAFALASAFVYFAVIRRTERGPRAE